MPCKPFRAGYKCNSSNNLSIAKSAVTNSEKDQLRQDVLKALKNIPCLKSAVFNTSYFLGPFVPPCMFFLVQIILLSHEQLVGLLLLIICV